LVLLGRLALPMQSRRTLSLILAVGLPILMVAAVIHGMFSYTALDLPRQSLSSLGSIVYAVSVAVGVGLLVLAELKPLWLSAVACISYVLLMPIVLNWVALLVSCFNGSCL
jgi:hypothetical protein